MTNRVPAERVRPLLAPLLEDHPLYVVGEMVGCSHETVRAVMNGDKEWVSLYTVDKWATRLERPDFLHVELADLYQAEEIVDDKALAEAIRRAEAAEKRAAKWYAEVRRLREARATWKAKYERLRRETERWRRAERYRAKTAAKKAA